jgi:hypothetical protein
MQCPSRHELTRTLHCPVTGGPCADSTAFVDRMEQTCLQLRRIIGRVPDMMGTLLPEACPHHPDCRLDWQVTTGRLTLSRGDRILASAPHAPVALQ